MSYIHVFLHLAFLLFAGASTLISGDHQHDDELEFKFDFNETMVKHSTKFFIHTKDHPEGIEFYVEEESPFIKKNISTKILIHGHVSAEKEIQWIVTEYLNAPEESNVITFSWKFIHRMSYLSSTRAAEFIGNFILPKAIVRIGCKYILQPYHIHLIGYNLGAHLAGVTGANLGRSIGRITGLDPSRNCFEVSCYGVTFLGLNKTDAKFVDVLHTSAYIDGFSDPIGTVDLYANGGTFQPACDQEFDLDCNSIMALKYFAESINSNTKFYGLQCPSYKKFLQKECKGFKRITWTGTGDIDTDTPSGSFYFKSEATLPYSQGLRGIAPK